MVVWGPGLRVAPAPGGGGGGGGGGGVDEKSDSFLNFFVRTVLWVCPS